MLHIDTDIQGFPLDEAMAALPPWRRERALAIRHGPSRLLSVMAYRLLCRALRVEHGIGLPPTFAYEEGGKPYLADHPHIFFNLSHCRAGAACALADRPVGVDAETVRPYKDTLARHVLNDAEYALVKESPDPAAAFTRLWTMKEAYAKLTGRGLRDDLPSLLTGKEGLEFETSEVLAADGRQRMIVTICQEATTL